MIYKQKPKNFNSSLDIVSTILISPNNEMLLLKRISSDNHGLKWGVPTGKFEPEIDSDFISGALRELEEETSIKLNSVFFHSTYYVVINEISFNYHLFYVYIEEIKEIVLAPNEHNDYVWCKPQNAFELDLIHDMDYVIKDFFKI